MSATFSIISRMIPAITALSMSIKSSIVYTSFLNCLYYTIRTYKCQGIQLKKSKLFQPSADFVGGFVMPRLLQEVSAL